MGPGRAARLFPAEPCGMIRGSAPTGRRTQRLSCDPRDGPEVLGPDGRTRRRGTSCRTSGCPRWCSPATEDPVLPIEQQREIAKTPSQRRASSRSRATTTCSGSATGRASATHRGVRHRKARSAPHHPDALHRPLHRHHRLDELAEELGDRRWREVLEEHDEICRRELDRNGGRLIKTMGDGALATFDGPGGGHPHSLRDPRLRRGGRREDQAGLHTGEVELMNGDIGGMAVHIAARVSAEAGADEVLVSRRSRT